MIERIKRLGSETVVYGVSTILGRFLTFLLTPLFANLLLPDELGIVATIYAYIAFLNVLYHYGMEPAYMKYVSTGELGSAKQTFSVPFLSIAATSLFFSGIIWLNAQAGADLMGVIHDEAGELIRLSALILILDALSYIPFAVLRMERKATRFAAIRITGIGANVVFVLLFLVQYDLGIRGIFLAGAVSSAVTLFLLVPTIISNLTFSVPIRIYRALILYGLPTLPAGVAAIILQVVDRPILQALTDTDTVGVYQASYRLGIFMMLVVSMFEFAWRPFFFTHARDDDAREMFGRVLTYLVFLMSGVFLAVAFFLDDIVKEPFFFGYSILPEKYWGGLVIVPVILLAYGFLGASTVFSAGLYIKKKTAQLPGITIAGAVLNIISNIILIPLIGIMGAALATLFSYALMAVLMYFFSKRVYSVRYETARIAKIVLTAALVYVAGMYLPSPIPPFLWKAFLLIVACLLLYWLKFLDPAELAVIRRQFRRESGTFAGEGSNEDLPPL